MAEKCQLQLNFLENRPLAKQYNIEDPDNGSTSYSLIDGLSPMDYRQGEISQSPEIIEINEDSDIDNYDDCEELCESQKCDNVFVTQSTNAVCKNECCSDEKDVYQLKDNKTLQLFTNKNRRFLQA